MKEMNFEFQIATDFSKWATGFSGMDGGNPNGPIWFSGIEFGGDIDHIEELDFDENVNEIPYREDVFDSEEFGKTQYNQKIAKVVYSYINGYLDDNWREYMNQKLYTIDGDSLKMNLYPIPFKNSNEKWTGDLYKLTGIPDKKLYHSWCKSYRFPLLRDLVRKYNPKFVICTSNKHRDNFLYAFCEHDKLSKNIIQKRELIRGNEIEIYLCNKNKTYCIITPFFGQGGIMADDELEDLAMICREL